MASQINASNSGFGGIVSTGDSSGELQLQTAGTTAVTINTSQRAAFVAGTAALPAITTTGDTNTGIFFPTADTIAFAEGGTESMRIDSSGNVGIGVVPSAWSSASNALQNSGGALWQFGGSNFYVGQNYYFNGTNRIYTTTAEATEYQQGAGMHRWFTAPSGTVGNAVTFTERMRIDSSGNLLIGGTSSYAGTEKLSVTSTIAGWPMSLNCTGSSTNGLLVRYSTSPNNNGAEFFSGIDSTATRCYFKSNGGLANYSANNTNLSDIREKKDIKLAGSYIDKICAIPVKTFLFNDQTDTDLNLGVIAQDVQAVAPELVMESNWAAPDQPEKLRLSIYQTDLQYALMKCIQEQQTIINDLKARIETLEAK